MTTTSITSGTNFIGKTLIIGSTGTSNTDYARVVEFNNNSTGTYLGVMFSATNKQPWFSFRPLGHWYSEPIMNWTASLNVYYIYVFSFISDIQVKYNIYEYNIGASTIISKGTIYTYNAAVAYLQNLTQFWLGRSIWNNDFYNGTYNKITLYNGDLFALTDANILSTLFTLVTSTQTNIINNSTTYTFRPLGPNFLGVVVNILNYNTTSGSSVTTSNITLIGSGSTSGGYLNIIGTYIGTPNSPTGVTATTGNAQAIINWTAPTNNGGSAITSYTVTSSPGGLTATTANGLITTATVTGLTNDTTYTFTVVATNIAGSSIASLASNSVISIIMHNFNFSNKSWKMYTHTLSSISGDNLTIKPYVGKNILLEVSANDAIFIKQGDVSYNLTNLATGRGIVSGSDASFSNIDISGNLNPLIVNRSSIGLETKNWNSAYINNIYGETLNTYRSDKTLAINSNISTISGDLITSGNINPLTGVGSSLGISSKIWGNAYIRDVSVTSIDISGHIICPRDISINIGSSLRRWRNVFSDDLSVNKINGQVYSGSSSSIVLTSVSGNIIPSSNNLFNLGDVSRNWSNAYIRDLSISSIDVSLNLNPLTNNSASLGLLNKLWGNAYLCDASISSIDVSTNLNPLTNNGSSLGLISKTWGNAYIRDVSISYIDVSQNLNPLTNNGSSLGLPGKYWGNAYLRDISISSIDVSVNSINPFLNNSASLGAPSKTWGNAYIRDLSVSSIDVSGNLNPLTTNTLTLGLPSKVWGNAYIRDISISSIDVSINSINPFLNNGSGLGLVTKTWSNAYLRDASVSSIDISQNLNPLVSGSSNLGSSLKRWKNIFVGDLSVNTINGLAYSSGGGAASIVYSAGGSSIVNSAIVSNMIPSLTNTYSLGSTTKYWNNAYIRDLRVSNRAYQEISGDISWSAVNGYYGLAKDAYPALNPLSSGVKAVKTWTGRTSSSNETNGWHGVCWSPELGLYVAVAFSGTNRVMTSPDGINWSPRVSSSNETNGWHGVCWSPQRMLFVAVANSGTNRVMTSSNGINWTGRTSSNETNSWINVCWSPERSLFVAVAYDGTNKVMTSPDGITWTGRVSSNETNQWWSVCWSKELGIFVAVAAGGTNSIMTSPDGITWTGRIPPNDSELWHSVCWSPELGIFAAVSPSGNGSVMTSSNGTSWTLIAAANANNWYSVCWCKELSLFVAVAQSGSLNKVMTSCNGITWTGQLSANESNTWYSICWSPELGIFAAVAGAGTNRVMTSSLKGRPPTSYNVFDSSFNSIDETGKWDFSNIAISAIMTAGATNVASDDRLKHNEVVINNGLAVIDQLRPKFYQKTQNMLDASYNGDLSEHVWTYEAGLIAQEVLQIPDISFVVSGGDYYETVMNYELSYNNLSVNDLSVNDLSVNDLSYTIIYYESGKYLISQKYTLNYNSIITYGIAAIKELHAKVKAQDISLLEQHATINSLLTRLQALDPSAN